MVVCGGRSRPSRVRVRIESQNQQLMSVRISTQKVPLFMEGLFFLFAVDLWTTMPQRPSLCCGFQCFSWLSFCSFDHSPFSHFPCSVSCVLCFRSSSYAFFLTAGLMCYWTLTCGTRRVVCRCVWAKVRVAVKESSFMTSGPQHSLWGHVAGSPHCGLRSPVRSTLMRLHHGPRLEAATAASFSQDHQPPPSPTGTSRSGLEALRLQIRRTPSCLHKLLDVIGRETDCCWWFGMVTVVPLQSVGQGDMREKLVQETRAVVSLWPGTINGFFNQIRRFPLEPWGGIWGGRLWLSTRAAQTHSE